MDSSGANRNPRWQVILAGFSLMVTAFAVQGAVVTRLVGAVEIKTAEKLAENEEEIQQHLARAAAVDRSNGRANWLRARGRLRQAKSAEAAEMRCRSEAARAKAAGNERLRTRLELTGMEQNAKRIKHLEAARDEALRGTDSFNSIESLLQLGMIYMRLAGAYEAKIAEDATETAKEKQERWTDAESSFEKVARVKPDDFEAIERLGMIKLRLKKWEELEAMCKQILYRHPYSPNVYYYLAHIAREKQDPEAYYFNLRQAYWMMVQETGTIFFPRANLENMVFSFNLVERPEKEPGATPSGATQ